jgi:hypothetical protein
MKHLSEEELIEHYYGMGRGAKASARHLEACPECAEAFAALRRDLAEMEFAEPPVRGEAYGVEVWESIRHSLPVYEARKRGWLRVGHWKALSYTAACALLVAGAFYAGRLWEQKQTHPAAQNNPLQQVQPHPDHPKPRVVVVVLSDHLDRSERLLVELKHVDADSPEMVSPLRDEARSLLAANRICRQNAQQEDDPALTKALDRLDRVLDELANHPGGLNAATLTRLQDEMNADGLLFEVRVLRSRLPDTPTAVRSNGGKI